MNQTAVRIARRKIIDTVQDGNLIRVNGRIRVARDVTRSMVAGRSVVKYITMSILVCSWTTKPYTVYNRYDLSAKPFEVVDRGDWRGFGVMADLLQQDILAKRVSSSVLKACDVVGVMV